MSFISGGATQSGSKKCPRGQILKSGYQRKPYTRLDGTTVRGSFVDPTCIEDKGHPGKGKNLIPIKGDVKLHEYGYAINAPDNVRQRAIRQAMYQHPEGARKVQQHLVAIANLQSNTRYADKFRDDIDYSKKIYKKLKSRGLTGGQVSPSDIATPTTLFSDPLSDPEDLTDRLAGELNDLDLKGYKYEPLAGKRFCDEDGVCSFDSFASEPQYIDGKKIVFSTMSLGDPEIKTYFDANKLSTEILETNGPEGKGLLVMKLDDRIVAYCVYRPRPGNAVEIMEIHVIPGVRTAFFNFLHKFFKINDYTAIYKKIHLDHPDAKMIIEFFNDRDYKIVKIPGADSNRDKTIWISKQL
jgi:hypothetical protein